MKTQLVYYWVIFLGPPMEAPSSCQAGIGTYTGNVLKTPIIESIQIAGQCVRSQHVKGPSSRLVPPSHNA